MALPDKLHNLFHPLVARWFGDRVGLPTDIQNQAWSRIASGEHVLITAPTGSGKTLAAFLWTLNQLVTGQWPTGQMSVLYVSPLRALNNDIQRNLLGPLEELRKVFLEAKAYFPEVHVLTRSGDTPQSDRRRMLRHPPEILITTPESLNLLLSSGGGCSILHDLSTVILDEIHAIYGTKRGTYLITAVDRLVRQSGEFQRIGLSATVRPLANVAEFLGGFRMLEGPQGFEYQPRPVALVRSDQRKSYRLVVRHPHDMREELERGSTWDPLIRELKGIIERNRSTLVFVNSRRLCEFLTLRINKDEEEPLAYAHHGSLSLEIRAEVERRLKAGELRAIVATHSLELGIDIGSLDEVVLVQSPFSVSSAIQRIGRSRHQVGETSLGTLFATHPRDLLEAAALAPSILEHDIELQQPVLCPLDVLAQNTVSMAATEAWDIGLLYATLKASYPYRHLNRELFDLVLDMLTGRYAETRIRELKPLLSVDRLDNTVAAKRGALQTLYLSGGVIPDRGYFHLRHHETKARIGDLDEEFVWEARVGDTFTFGTQNWEIRQITHNDVLVTPARPDATSAPFWKGEEYGRDFHFSEHIGRFLEEIDPHLDDHQGLVSRLQEERCMDAATAGHLIEFLRKQREATSCSLPHRHHLVAEFVSTGPQATPSPQVVLHTLWGARVNRPFAMALDAAWQERFGQRPELFVSNDSVVVLLPHGIRGEELLSLVQSTRVESLLRMRLEGSGYFGARFRECAGRALLLPRRRFNERMPLWLSRLRSQRLLEAVMPHEDFPILLEAWRTCLNDEFDLENLRRLLGELESGEISWTEVRTSHPSPFAQSDGWRQINQYMYMDDTPRADRRSGLRPDLLHDILFQEGLRPTVGRNLVERFESKRQRLSPGYSPQTPRELIDWVVERVLIPQQEWVALIEAMARDHGSDPSGWIEVHDKLVQIHPPRTEGRLVVARQSLHRIIRGLYESGTQVRISPLGQAPSRGDDVIVERDEAESEDRGALLGEWLQFYGPVTVAFVQGTLGIEQGLLEMAFEELTDGQKVVRGRLITDGSPDEICDAQNFETLLRLARQEARPAFEPLDIGWLPWFLADHQGLVQSGDDLEGLRDCLEKLPGYPSEASTWESEIFPARLRRYDPSWLDSLIQEGDLAWLGMEGHRVVFCYRPDLDLLSEESLAVRGEVSQNPDNPTTVMPEPFSQRLSVLFPDASTFRDLSAMIELSGEDGAELVKEVWREVWEGRLTNDTFVVLRQAILNRFKLPEGVPKRLKRLRERKNRLSRSAEKEKARLFAGHWHLLPQPDPPEGLLEIEELRKDRVRLLLDRYGVLFRELLQREMPALRWSSVFRALRIMELAGEVMTGVFFEGIPGLQFASPTAFQKLQRIGRPDSIYWMNATDPASLCGISLESLRGTLPPRLPTTHLVYRGKDLVFVSKRNGSELVFHVPPGDPALTNYFISLHHLLTRKFQPMRRILVETINTEKANQSPYLPALRASFDVTADHTGVALYRKVR